MAMRHAFIPFIATALLVWPLAQGHAQSREAMRDSLLKASEQLEYHPDSIDLRLRKARWNMELEEWATAKGEYDKVLGVNPANIAALYYRAYCNDRLGRYNFARLDYQNLEALDGINQLVAAHPDSAIAWAARAGIESEHGMKELAAYDYGEALKRDPDNKDYLLARADLNISLGNAIEARHDLDRLVKLGTPKAALKEWYGKLK